MIEGRAGADAHEFLDADIDRRMTGIVLEMWYGVPGHVVSRKHPTGSLQER